MRASIAIALASVVAVACGAFEPSVGARRDTEVPECAEYVDAAYGAPPPETDAGCGDDT